MRKRMDKISDLTATHLRETRMESRFPRAPYKRPRQKTQSQPIGYLVSKSGDSKLHGPSWPPVARDIGLRDKAPGARPQAPGTTGLTGMKSPAAPRSAGRTNPF